MVGHLRRFTSFAMIGVFCFLLSVGLVQLFVMYGGDPRVIYPFTLAFAIAMNFVLSRRFTWNDRDTDFWQSARRTAISRVGTAAIEYALFTGLVFEGVNVLGAQTVAVAVSMFLNYTIGYLWAFANRQPVGRDEVVLAR